MTHKLLQTLNKLHQEIDELPKVQAFLSSIRRNSIRTAFGYMTSLVYLQEFLSSHYNNTLESILKALSTGENKGGSIDVYEILEQFIAFMQQEK
ncbi:MAG: hypothetical protein ACJ71M_02405, partial [Nitrososphaeraceae archaeon]